MDTIVVIYLIQAVFAGIQTIGIFCTPAITAITNVITMWLIAKAKKITTDNEDVIVARV